MMRNPFDEVIEHIKAQGYHNQRQQSHSDILCEGIFRDLCTRCESIREDHDAKKISHWLNVKTPGARNRKIDLFVGDSHEASSEPDLNLIRIGVENKSIITAHRNCSARFDDLRETLQEINRVKAEAVVVATVMVGVAPRVLNVPDRIIPLHKDFEQRILPRLSKGDESLWGEFDFAVSKNRATDPKSTVEKFKMLPTRNPGHTHVLGYDYVLIVPVFIDNIHEPRVMRDNDLGIDVDTEYENMIETVCRAYKARWHI